jgi:flagellar basal body-associated protein FliL
MTTAPTPAPTPAHEPSTQERLAWMRKNSKRLIIALIVIILAAVVVTFSFSLFTSSSASPGNMVASGSMDISNSKEDAAVLTVAGLLPGESADGTVTIENVGESEGAFSMSASNLADAPADPALSSQLTLVVTDETTEVYNGALAALTTVDLGTWQPGDSHTYTFTVTFASAAGNEYQDAQTTLDLTWDAAQVTG